MKNPHIVIDCFKFLRGTGKSYGIPISVQRLIRNLKTAYPDMNLTVLGNKYTREDFDICGVNFIEIDKDPHSRLTCLVWELFTVSKVLKKIKADKVFFPRGFSALTHPVYDIVQIHDMIPFFYDEKFPGHMNKFENAYVKARLKQSARTAKEILTISEASKRDIVKYARCNPDKIRIIEHSSELIDYDGTHGGGGYLCAVTSPLPHKNAKGIVASYAAYRKLSQNPLPLHIIGIESAEPYGADEELSKHIVCHKFIQDPHEMHELIAHAEVFLFLSLIEGSGYPPVEAMNLGAPVVCANNSSLPEVCGDAAKLVDAENPEEVANALILVQENEDLREEMRAKAAVLKQSHTWKTRTKLYHDLFCGEE
ncbi:MAG: glycosyltransferase family 4 protein [Clostridia bacterium]|nr:glycosyltransferase family 4 protein [Clostridia bacterium]